MASRSVGQSQPPELRITLLGGFRVRVNDREVGEREWKRRSAAAIVKILALTPGHRLHREQLMEMLWPDSDPEQASNNLYQGLYAARRALGSEPDRYLVLNDQIIQFAPDVVLSVDTFEFMRAVNEARQRQTPDAYRAALQLFTGELLPDDRFEFWAADSRETLESLFAEAALELAGLDDGTDAYSTTMAALERVVSNDPLHEPAHRALMRIYAETGQRHRALRQYGSLEAALADELDVEPDPATAALVARIRAGEYERTERATSPLDTTNRSGNNLPEPVNRFIGRDREVSEVRRMLRGARLLTLTGPGGCGKTRLALEVARSLTADFSDGAWLIELASLSDPELIPQEIASALGIREVAGQPVMRLLTNWLRERETLLVFDNCEHLIDASARVVESLLRASAGLRVLATSREPLRIGGESTWIVPSLSLPDPGRPHDPETLQKYEAIQLFVERAHQVATGFSLTSENATDVAELCYRLDGIPLALELAAARVRTLTVQQIVERLDDRFRLLKDGSRAALSRQQTLRAALDWSYDLLSQEEQLFFARLSVFSNGFSLDAAESICAIDPLEPTDVLDLLTALVDRSLVVTGAWNGEVRYHLLETMRQYARERLIEAREERVVAAAHAEYFAALGELGSREIRGAGQRDWLDRLETEHDNLRASLEWFREQGTPETLEQGLLLAGRLHWFWHLKGHFSEGQSRLKQMIEVSSEPHSSGYATALTGLGDLALAIGDYETGRAALERSTAIWRQFADPAGLALALIWMGWAELFHGHTHIARSNHHEGLKLFTELADSWGVAMATLGLGFDAAELNEVDTAREAFERALLIFRQIGDEWGIATTLQQTAHLIYRAGDFETARERVIEVLEIERRMGDTWLAAQSEGLLGEIARATGDIETAAAASEACLKVAADMGHFAFHAWLLRDAGFVALAQGRQHQAREYFLESFELFREREYPLGMVCCVVGLAGVAADNADYELAASLLGAADTELNRIRMSLAPADQRARKQIAASIRREAAADVIEGRRRRGASTSLPDAIADFKRH